VDMQCYRCANELYIGHSTAVVTKLLTVYRNFVVARDCLLTFGQLTI